MSGAVTAVVAVASLANAALSYKQGQAQQSAAQKAANAARANADKQAQQAEQAMNAANQKKPDTSVLLSAVQQAGKGGVSGTTLTGPAGVPSDTLTLGRSTLLGS